MRYKDFKKKADVITNLLDLLGMLKYQKVLIDVDHHPDFDLTEYRKHDYSDYVFKMTWNYQDSLRSLMDIHIERIGIFSHDDLSDLAEEFQIKLPGTNSYSDALTNLYKKSPSKFMDVVFEDEIDSFKINTLNVERVDNEKKEVHFIGGFRGDSMSISQMYWGVVMECIYFGFTAQKNNPNFYIDLLSEAFSIKKTGNLKLAYFLCFSAFENYVNEYLSAHNKEGRLKDKLNEVFKFGNADLLQNQIYSSVAPELSELEDIRNTIAHGRDSDGEVEESTFDRLVLFVLTLMASRERDITTFRELANQIS